jgi:uncharacterized OB-fold protein
VTELQIFRCAGCGLHVFPERLRCFRCGAREFQAVAAGPGRVEERTALRRRGVRLGSVRLASGPVVIARLGEDAEGEVRLEEHPDGAIEARGGQ